MESGKQFMQAMQKFATTSYFFIICLLFSYAVYFIIFMSHFYFAFESILNQSYLLL